MYVDVQVGFKGVEILTIHVILQEIFEDEITFKS